MECLSSGDSWPATMVERDVRRPGSEAPGVGIHKGGRHHCGAVPVSPEPPLGPSVEGPTIEGEECDPGRPGSGDAAIARRTRSESFGESDVPNPAGGGFRFRCAGRNLGVDDHDLERLGLLAERGECAREFGYLSEGEHHDGEVARASGPHGSSGIGS